MLLRIITPDGLVLSEVPDVAGKPRVTDSGALVAPLPDGGHYIVAPGQWIDAQDSPDPDAKIPDWLTHSMIRRASRAMLFRTPAREVPFVPGPVEGPEPTPEPPAAGPRRQMPGDDWPAVVHEPPTSGPLSIVCICDQLRCPVVLNEATEAQRGWWRARQQKGRTPGKAPNPEPLMRCSFAVGHGGEHEWLPGDGDTPPGWPFGPTRHHDECPRNPLNQRPEGQPRGKHAAVVVGITGDTSSLTELAHDATDPAVTEVGSAPIALVRPKPGDDPDSWLASLAGNSNPGLPSRPAYNPDAEPGHCGRWAPGWDSRPGHPDRSCELLTGHTGAHRHHDPVNREELRWPNDDARGQVS